MSGLLTFRSRTHVTYPSVFAPNLRLSCLQNQGFWRHNYQYNLRRKGTASFEAGEEKSGHIKAGPGEGILFFDDVTPLRLTWALRLPFKADRALENLMSRLNSPGIAAADPASIVQRAIPPEIPLKVTEVMPRLKEGGAFVKFSYPSSTTLKDIESSLKEHLKQNPITPWFNPFSRVKASLVQGKPWIEDLYRFPSSRLRVEFLPAERGEIAGELTQETLYSLFRKYGKLADIIPQPADSKVLPKYTLLDFSKIRHAVMAKNCLHGFVVRGAEGGQASTIIKLAYEEKIKAHWIRDWLANHPRIVIPAIAALVAGISVAVFDPIRTFFIEMHITQFFHVSDNRIWRWLRERASYLTLRPQKPDEAGLRAIWDDRKADIERIHSWLMESADTFIVVHGPRGSGKKELVLDQALEGRRHKLVIDCKPIQEARGDSATISAAAKEVGYRPIFSWLNSINSMFDLAAQATIGAKTGFSETVDSQLAKIFQSTSTALKRIALASRKKSDKDADLSDDEWLEAHPERRPVVVVDNFLHKSNEGSIVYDKIAEWAATLSAGDIAHVIFLTRDGSFSKSLDKALPNHLFRTISLGDCSTEVAKRFVINHLDADADDEPVAGEGETKLTLSQRRKDLEELDGCIEVLGGRLTDLEFLARRIKSGETPSKAVQEIISQSASEILKMHILDTDPSTSSRPWTPEQAWLLIKQLASSPDTTIPYHKNWLEDTYRAGGPGNNDSTIQSLEQAELISVVLGPNGRPSAIRPGKPVYAAAFKRLVEDRVLAARLDLALALQLIKLANADIAKYEDELRLLGKLPKTPSELNGRIQWLLGKIRANQERVEGFERESKGAKEVLGLEY
ncbi:MAG: mitochondrial escape protein 2 [Cirrosporium novae-zelandiae]|nr:MAG: mitochondrial escape protein 2 [Cirrosporium novae-zelandiae]